MKKFPKPWYRPSRGTWFVTLNGQQHNLGADRDKAFEEYAKLLKKPSTAPRQRFTSDSVVAVIDRYLDWCKEHRAAETYEWYRWRLQLFAESIDRTLSVDELKHYHLDEWLSKRPDWSSGTKHGMARAVQRALRWAARKGYIDRSPISDYEKARPGKRNVVISALQFETILGFVRKRPFRDLLIVSWETGCRPQESLIVEARHVDLVNSRWIFPPEESKGELWPRIVYLTEKALEITERLMKQHRHGRLFRNTTGKPWTTDAVNCCFTALRHRFGRAEMQRLGIEVEKSAVEAHIPTLKPVGVFKGVSRAKTKSELEHESRRKLRHKLAEKYAPRYCLYHLRHSWLDRALKSGVDPLTCAILMGHRDPSTLTKVYQHLSQSPAYLRDAAEKAVG